MNPGSNIAARAVPLALYLLAAGLLVADLHDAALTFLLIGIAASVLLEFRNRRSRSNELPTLSVEQEQSLRSQREQAGEVTAVKQLRNEYPELSLVDATRLIRAL